MSKLGIKLFVIFTKPYKEFVTIKNRLLNGLGPTDKIY